MENTNAREATKATKECWEDNGGGLTIVWRDKSGKIIAAAWGLEYQYKGGDGKYDMVDWDDYKNCDGNSMGWVDTNTSNGAVSVKSIQNDINEYEPLGNMTLVAKNVNSKLTLYPDKMGYAAKKYFNIK